MGYSRKYPHTPLMDDTDLGTYKFQDFQERQQQFLQRLLFQNPEEFQNFTRLNGFPGMSKFANFAEIHKISSQAH